MRIIRTACVSRAHCRWRTGTSRSLLISHATLRIGLSESKKRQWLMRRSTEPDIPTIGYPGGLEGRPNFVRLRGMTLQVIMYEICIVWFSSQPRLQFSEIVFISKPGGPAFQGSHWHIEGMKNESIVACVLYNSCVWHFFTRHQKCSNASRIISQVARSNFAWRLRRRLRFPAEPPGHDDQHLGFTERRPAYWLRLTSPKTVHRISEYLSIPPHTIFID
jgi:hypothetical protein